MKDFENALHAAAALSFGAAYIVTRNMVHYHRSPVPAISASEFVRKMAI